MSLQVTFDTPINYVIRPVWTTTLTSINIQRIIDDVLEKEIVAVVEGLGRIKLDALSNENYDNPPWTNEMVIEAIKSQLST
jgi:hypothetical protein